MYKYIYIYIFIYLLIALGCLTSKVLTVLYFPYIAHLAPHLVLYFPDVVHSTRKQRAYLGFSQRTPSTSFSLATLSIQTTINHLKHQFCSCCTGKYSTVCGVSKPHTALCYASCCMSFSTPLLVLYFLYSTLTSALIYTYIYIYIYIIIIIIIQ